MSDASFRDGQEKPLNIGAMEPEDVQVISALVQDAVFPISEMQWARGQRRFALLLNRFRWEDTGQQRHGAERVQSLLMIQNVLGVASQGIDRADSDVILSLLSVSFTQTGEGPEGEVLLTLAGDGAIRLQVEAPEMQLRDVTRPYRAPSGKVPTHE
jgi:hypothetical protein